MSDNLHPVDELFRLRADKVAIEVRIDELREMISEMPARERVGREAEATLQEQVRTILDRKAVIYEMGQKWFDQRSKKSIVKIVKVKAI